MFCPECKAAYRPGFTRCPDCDVDLVADLSETSDSLDRQLSRPDFRSIWKGDDQESCVAICARLREKGIPFNVTQHRFQYLKGVQLRLQIAVPSSFFGRAMEVIDRGRLDFTDDADDQRTMELPAQDARAASEPLEADRERTAWHPENATVEVWFGVGDETASLVESCLRENQITARIDVSGDSSRRIFVTPGDESRAREVVRELKDGSPPK